MVVGVNGVSAVDMRPCCLILHVCIVAWGKTAFVGVAQDSHEMSQHLSQVDLHLRRKAIARDLRRVVIIIMLCTS